MLNWDVVLFSIFRLSPWGGNCLSETKSVGDGEKIRKNEEGSILQQAEGNSKGRRRKRQKDTFFNTPADLVKGPSPRRKVQNHQLFFKHVPGWNNAVVIENTEKQIVE